MNLLKSHSYLSAFFVFFVLVIALRPVLPIDETRYLTVAWEMFLSKNYVLPTLNFAPYHHKPPMLFWLINLFWEIFGVSRWSAQIPVFFGGALVLLLSGNLAGRIYPKNPQAAQAVPWLLLGSVPFLIYSTLVMFDVMLAGSVLACLLVFLSYAGAPAAKKVVLAGLIMGCGVLIKGPVAYLYILWPLILYPYWRFESHTASRGQFYRALGLAFLISGIPVSCWLVPLLLHADNNFAYWLLWEQTAGRVQGNFSSSHARPFYFYILFAPVLFLPWAFLPSFWRGVKTFSLEDRGVRFLLCAVLPVFVSFSLIAGKQPHYLVPLLPFIMVGLAGKFTDVRKVRRFSAGMIVLFIAVMAVLSQTVFRNYDLAPVAEFYHAHRDREFAYIPKYQGEIGFLARMEKPLQPLYFEQMDDWFAAHPDGLAIVRHDHEVLEGYAQIFSIPYRGRELNVYRCFCSRSAREEGGSVAK